MLTAKNIIVVKLKLCKTVNRQVPANRGRTGGTGRVGVGGTTPLPPPPPPPPTTTPSLGVTKKTSPESSFTVSKRQQKYSRDRENGFLHCTIFQNFPGRQAPGNPTSLPLKETSHASHSSHVPTKNQHWPNLYRDELSV